MTMVPGTCVVFVGACAVDTILTVPYFPGEDSKLRALSSSKRRGGNCPNTIEVLHQLIQSKGAAFNASEKDTPRIGSLVLISSMPSRSSPIMPFIHESFSMAGKDSTVNLSYCIHREDQVDPVSSYIISSHATGSRTIVNHNPLPEMTYEEFTRIADSLLDSSNKEMDAPMWFHFEGRIPEIILECMRYLRRTWQSQRTDTGLTISVELEKPGREGLQELASHADIVIYSRSWAEGQGYISATECLLKQTRLLQLDDFPSRARRTLICTWDKLGAWGLSTGSDKSDNELDVLHSPASSISESEIIDTVGAGDTFIAGILFGLINKEREWSLRQILDFANALAGQKIMQQGFSGLAECFAYSV